MQVADIVRRVRDAAGDVGVLQFTNVTLTDWLNDGIRECVLNNDLLQARANSITIPNQDEYTLPNDIFKIHSVIIDGLKMTILTREEWEKMNSAEPVGSDFHTGSPYNAYVYAGILHLWPVPNTAVEMQINYTKLPVSIVFDEGTGEWAPSAPIIPEQFHSRLVTYCLAQVAFQDDMYEKYQALMMEFETGVRQLGNIKDDQQDLYPFISVAGRDMGEHPDTWGVW